MHAALLAHTDYGLHTTQTATHLRRSRGNATACHKQMFEKTVDRVPCKIALADCTTAVRWHVRSPQQHHAAYEECAAALAW